MSLLFHDSNKFDCALAGHDAFFVIPPPPGFHPRSSPVYWFLRKYNFVNFEEAPAVTVVTNVRPA
jgi:hypothetical protein